VRKTERETERERARARAPVHPQFPFPRRGLASLEAEEGSEVKRVFSPPSLFSVLLLSLRFPDRQGKTRPSRKCRRKLGGNLKDRDGKRVKTVRSYESIAKLVYSLARNSARNNDELIAAFMPLTSDFSTI
jgi:hypothetical protein